MSFKIYAVGSNAILTNEIKDCMDELLGHAIEVIPCEAANVEKHCDGNLYVCNQSQYRAVSRYIQPAHIALLNLTPTTSFYVSVRAIPAGSDVYVFNNHVSYCHTMIELCRQFGLTDYNYIPLGYEETPAAELDAALSCADYIIGITRILNVLQEEPYQHLLKKDVHLIGAVRVSSVATTAGILSTLNGLLLQSVKQQLLELETEAQMMRNQNVLHAYYDGLSVHLRGIQSRMDYLLNSNLRENENDVMKAAINQLR